MKKPTRDVLLKWFSYDENTGLFTRIARPCGKVKVGDIPSCKSSEGYIHFRLAGTLHRAHRLAWLAATGEWPEGQIDHINGIRTDNRFCNLRLVTNGQNQQNRSAARKDNNSSKHMGVGFFSINGKWRARIQVDKRPVWLGYFESEQEAADAYRAAKAKLHPYASKPIGGTL